MNPELRPVVHNRGGQIMFRDVLSRMEGIDILPLLGLFIFFTLFIAMLVWVFHLSKNYIKTMSNMPLDDEQPSDQQNKKNLE